MLKYAKFVGTATLFIAVTSYMSCSRLTLHALKSTAAVGAEQAPEAAADQEQAPAADALAEQSLAAAANIDRFMEEHRSAAHVVGFEAIVVKHGKIAWEHGYGYSDLKSRQRINVDTLFRVASVSKTLTAAALMRLYEQGKVRLDDDINAVLPFPVRHPLFPNVPITYRMLMTHTAGINDNYAVISPLWNWQGDSSTPLGKLIYDYFAPHGASFGKSNFLATAPGKASSYSNMGIALLGYLVEVIGREPFTTVVAKDVLHPLSLTSASWTKLPGNPEPGVSRLYNWLSDENRYQELGPYGYPEVPAGMLRISGRHLARFMSMLINRGQIDGMQFLKPSTVAEMERLQVPEINDRQGLVFFRINGPEGHRQLVGHNGGDPGVAAEMYWEIGNPDGLGIIVLANTDATTGDDDPDYHRAAAFHDIVAKLLEIGSYL